MEAGFFPPIKRMYTRKDISYRGAVVFGHAAVFQGFSFVPFIKIEKLSVNFLHLFAAEFQSGNNRNIAFLQYSFKLLGGTVVCGGCLTLHDKGVQQLDRVFSLIREQRVHFVQKSAFKGNWFAFKRPQTAFQTHFTK